MIIKILTKVSLLLVLSASFSSCNKYDDSDLQNKYVDLNDRIATIEEWSKTVNTNISSLQGLIRALESNDTVTGVVEAADKSGYTISFSKSPSITIKNGTNGTNGTDGANGTNGVDGTDGVNGADGAIGTGGVNGNNGTDGTAPIIGVKIDDGIYYWTIQQGTSSVGWLYGENGEKIRTTGNNGKLGVDGKPAIAPKVKIDPDTDEWLISTDDITWGSTGVKATGYSVFAKDGVDTTNPDNVTITLADGVTKITLPRSSTLPILSIGFKSYETIKIIKPKTTIKVNLPSTLKAGDYSMISAEVKSISGSDIDIKTRAAIEPWRVTITKPIFEGGVYGNNVEVELVAPSDNNALEDPAVLTVTIVDNKGDKFTASLSFTAFIGDEIHVATEGTLEQAIKGSSLTPSEIKGMIVTGILNDVDFKYIEDKLTNLNALDLSETDLTKIPNEAFNSNETLKTFIFPNKLTSIGDFVFTYSGLTGTLNLPNSVKKIGQYTFRECSFTGTLTLPSNVETIENGAFNGCSGFTGTLIIPSSVTSIGEYAFMSCNMLTAIKMEKLEPIPYTGDMFPYDIQIYVPNSALTAYQAEEGWKAMELIGYEPTK